MPFLTEKRIEELLEWETRRIKGPQGWCRLTNTKAFWKGYDFLIFFGIDTSETLRDDAVRASRETGASFYSCLEALVWRGNVSSRRILGLDGFGVYAPPRR